MHVFFFVEEASAEAALQSLVPSIVGSEHTFEIFSFPGKQALLKRLPSRLAGYRWVTEREDYKIVVLVDRDRDDCKVLKKRLEAIAKQCGLVSKSNSRGSAGFHILNRVVIEELEAWFFGDVAALLTAYPKLPANLQIKRKLREPDAITDTWRELERELQLRGYFSSGLAKIEFARSVAVHMDPETNRSASFRCFRDGLRALVSQ